MLVPKLFHLVPFLESGDSYFALERNLSMHPVTLPSNSYTFFFFFIFILTLAVFFFFFALNKNTHIWHTCYLQLRPWSGGETQHCLWGDLSQGRQPLPRESQAEADNHLS